MIWRPTDDTPLTPLRVPFGLVADSVDAELDARGFSRYATKALMDANTTAVDGAHATVYADGTPANNGDYAASGGLWRREQPYIMATGVGSVVFAGPAKAFTITLPAGRFTQPPIITIMTNSNAYGTTFSGVATSPTNVNVQGFSGQAGLTVPYQWIAVQMAA